MSEEDERSVGRREDDASMPVVVHRLDSIERRMDEQAKEQARGFADVRQQIAALRFVQLDVYAADQRTADEVHKTLAKEITDLSTSVKLMWSVLGAAIIAGLITFLFIAGGTG